MYRRKVVVYIIAKEVLRAIDDGVICTVCNLGYVKFENIYNKDGCYSQRICCSNCNKELQIVYQSKPFKILEINELQ